METKAVEGSRTTEDQVEGGTRGIARRRALQVLGGALALPVLARLGTDDVFGAGHTLHAALDMGDGAYIFRTLDSSQRRTVMAIVDQIIPETDTPGALAANVHEFIDLILTEFAEREDRDSVLRGLADLDARALAGCGSAFADCDAARQLALLETLQQEAGEMPSGSRGWGSGPAEGFFHQLKYVTLWGYYTSEIGMTQEHPYTLVPGALPGCGPS